MGLCDDDALSHTMSFERENSEECPRGFMKVMNRFTGLHRDFEEKHASLVCQNPFELREQIRNEENRNRFYAVLCDIDKLFACGAVLAEEYLTPLCTYRLNATLWSFETTSHERCALYYMQDVLSMARNVYGTITGGGVLYECNLCEKYRELFKLLDCETLADEE